jgi:hypothetical protein
VINVQTGKVVKPIQTKGVKKLLDVKYKVFLEQCERHGVFRKIVDGVTSWENYQWQLKMREERAGWRVQHGQNRRQVSSFIRYRVFTLQGLQSGSLPRPRFHSRCISERHDVRYDVISERG